MNTTTDLCSREDVGLTCAVSTLLWQEQSQHQPCSALENGHGLPVLGEAFIGLWVQQVLEAKLCKGRSLLRGQATPGASACAPQVRRLHFRGQRQQMLHSRSYSAEEAWQSASTGGQEPKCAVLCN